MTELTLRDRLVYAVHNALTRLYVGNPLVRIATRLEVKAYALAQRCRTRNIRELQRQEWRAVASKLQFDPEFVREMTQGEE